MNITKQEIDALNTVVTIAIEKEDFRPNVDKVLNDYRKKASIPGFRKGFVPMSLIKKQYEKSVVIEEVNKLLQDELNKYIVEEKLDILGNPIPKPNSDFSWDNENFSFDFEMGLSPKFEINLEAKNNILLYKVMADEAFINEEMMHVQKQYGKLVTESEVSSDGRVVGTFSFEYKGEAKEKNANVEIAQINGKANQKKFIGKKIGDVIELKTKGLFNDDHDLMHALALDHDDAHGFDADVKFTITEISKYELAELNQELFDKLFGEGVIKSVDEFKAEIKKTAEKQFQGQADQKFLNDATDFLIKNTSFELPGEFLKRWLQMTGEKEMTFEEASIEFDRSEKGLRYQLIEGQLAKENNLQVTMEDLRSFAKNLLKVQYAQYGQELLNDEFLDGVADKVLQNQDEVKRLSEQVITQKLMNLYKEKMKYKTKEVTYKEFVEESYKK
jgi:trigger factor